jgi:hypothetical protein
MAKLLPSKQITRVRFPSPAFQQKTPRKLRGVFLFLSFGCIQQMLQPLSEFWGVLLFPRGIYEADLDHVP